VVTQPVSLLLRITEILERCGIPYAVGGSMASSQHGEPRATGDVDILVDLPPGKVSALVKALRPDFDVWEDSVQEAVARRSSISLLHVEWLTKVDLYVSGRSPLDPHALGRRRGYVLHGDPARPVYFVSPEDSVLQKLERYRLSGGVLERQLRDVAGVLKVQGRDLDLSYLRRTADMLGLRPLLEQALVDAGLEG
jgi:hypothetical protein